MFKMTADIKVTIPTTSVGGKEVVLKFKANSIKWNVSVNEICNTASFIIPAMCRILDRNKHYENVSESKNTGKVFKVGNKVEIYAGYDGKNDLQFSGFICRINFNVPLEVECEGYSYLLKQNYFNKSFAKTTVKEVLQFITKGTGILLSEKMSGDTDFEPHAFKNVNGFDVLKFLKEHYLLTIFFEYNKIYVGWLATYKAPIVKHRLNWNVIKTKELFFGTYEGSVVHIEGVSRRSDGTKLKVKSTNIVKPGKIKNVNLAIKSESDMQKAVNGLQDRHNQKGYSGSITTFLKPFVRPGMTTQIIDKKYAERNGSYFIESVEGSFSENGGRQKVGISFKLFDKVWQDLQNSLLGIV